MSYLNPHFGWTQKDNIDSETQSEIENLESVQKILDEAYNLVVSHTFEKMLYQSISKLYDLCEEHWYNSENYSLKILTRIFQKWITKYKPQGRSLTLFYLSKAMVASGQSSQKWIDYLSKAKLISRQQVFDSKQLISKIYIIQGDILSNESDIDSALQAYTEATQFVKENVGLFDSNQQLIQANSCMMESLYKSAVLSKDLLPPQQVLKMLQKSKEYATKIPGANGYLVRQIEEAEDRQNTRMKEQYLIQKQKQQSKQYQPIIIYQKQVDASVGQTKCPLNLSLKYYEDDRKMAITVFDKNNRQTITKQIPFYLKEGQYNSFIGDNYKKWMGIDEHFQIIVDEQRLSKVATGKVLSNNLQQKGKLIKIITKQDIHPNRSTNSGWQSSNQQYSREIIKQSKCKRIQQK